MPPNDDFGDLDSEIDSLFNDTPQSGSVVNGPGGDALQPDGSMPNLPSSNTTPPPSSGGTTSTAPPQKAPDDPSYKYNTQTGELNPNYIDPNAPTETPTGDTTGDAPEETLTPEQTAIQAAEAEYQAAYEKFNASIESINNGSVPLSAGEQAQIDGLQAEYNALIEQQKLANINNQGVANIRGYQTGAAEYDPTFQAKIIGSIVTNGLNAVMSLNTKMASEIAKLTQYFKDQDITAAKTAWDAYTEFANQRIDTLQKTIDDAQSKLEDARDFAYKQEQDALDRELAERKYADAQAETAKGSSDSMLSVSEIKSLQELYPDAGIDYGMTEGEAQNKISGVSAESIKDQFSTSQLWNMAIASGIPRSKNLSRQNEINAFLTPDNVMKITEMLNEGYTANQIEEFFKSL